MLNFLIDTQLPPSLAQLIIQLGSKAIHTTFFPEGHLLKDKEIRKIAIKEKRIIITKDNDFYDYFLLKGAPPRVLLLEIGNIKNQELFTLLQKNHKQIINFFEGKNNLVIVQSEKIIAY